MRMEEGLDTGPVYLERRVTIGHRAVAGQLSARLASLGGALLVETLSGLAARRDARGAAAGRRADGLPPDPARGRPRRLGTTGR